MYVYHVSSTEKKCFDSGLVVSINAYYVSSFKKRGFVPGLLFPMTHAYKYCIYMRDFKGRTWNIFYFVNFHFRLIVEQ